MAHRKLHIIVAEEEGKVKRFSFSVPFVKRVVLLSAVTIFILTTMSVLSIKFFWDRMAYRSQIQSLHFELDRIRAENRSLKNKVIALQKEKEDLLKGAVSELKEKSSIIEKILSDIGLKYKSTRKNGSSNSFSGGPYIPSSYSMDYGQLLDKATYLIENVKYIPLGYPVYGRITSGFGMRIDPFNGKLAFHPGVDIKGRLGLPVRVTADGVVKFVGYNRGYGKYVIVYHKKGFSTLYAHLSRIKVRRWQRVKRGDIIGLMGSTGRSTGPHLHYEIRVGGRPINPLKFIRIDRILKGKGHVRIG